MRASSQLLRQRADADEDSEHGREHHADDGHAQGIEQADQQRLRIGAGGRVGDQVLADIEARFTPEEVVSRLDVAAFEVDQRVADQEEADADHQPQHDNLPEDGLHVPVVEGATRAARWTEGRPLRHRRRVSGAVPVAAKKRAAAVVRSSPVRLQRMGGAYIRPPLFQRLLTPRGRPSGVDVARPDLAVVADRLDGLDHPVLIEADGLAHARRGAEDALDVGVGGGLGHLFDVGLRDAVLLGLEQREHGPLDDVGPLLVALRHGWSQRLLGDDLGQDDVVVGVLGVVLADRGQARRVGGQRVAAAGEEGGVHLGDVLDDDRLVLHVVGTEVVGEVELGRGAGLHADAGAGQLLGARHVELLRHHEALAVVVGGGREVEAELGVAGQRPGGVARQQVDLARLQGREALLGVERHELHLVAVAEQGGSNGAADVDVEADPLAGRVGDREAAEAGVDAADQLAARFDGVDPGSGEGGCARGGEQCAGQACELEFGGHERMTPLLNGMWPRP